MSTNNIKCRQLLLYFFQKVEKTAIMSKSLKAIRLSLIFQTCFDGTSVIVSVTVKITSVGYIILRSQVFVHNITMYTI